MVKAQVQHPALFYSDPGKIDPFNAAVYRDISSNEWFGYCNLLLSVALAVQHCPQFPPPEPEASYDIFYWPH